jgi:hypothetical protein
MRLSFWRYGLAHWRVLDAFSGVRFAKLKKASKANAGNERRNRVVAWVWQWRAKCLLADGIGYRERVSRCCRT